MKFSIQKKFSLLCLLILLNVIIRIPSVPHPIGDDSFVIHILANSISLFGYAKWWIHPMSIVGDYPYSYASAFPFFLSGISQCMDVETVHTIWLYCILIAVFSVFVAYLMAGELIDDDLFKFLTAFGFSLTPAILAYTSWTIPSRGFFIILLLLFIFLLLKCRNSILKYSFLTFVLILLLFSVHHYAYFIIVFLVSYIILIIGFNLSKRIKPVNVLKKLTPLVPIAGFFLMYSIPFFTQHFIEGSRYIDWISYVRYIGIFLVPAAGGLTYLIFKDNKKFGECFILLTTIFFTAFICKQTYMKFIIPIFVILLAGIGLKNVLEVSGQKKKYAVVTVIIFSLLFVSFSGFYQHWRTNVEGERSIHIYTWYIQETSYTGALWIKDNINMDKKLVYNDYLVARRMFALSEVSSFILDADVCLLTYGFANESDITIFKNSPSTEQFYMETPYVDISVPKVKWYGYNLRHHEVDSQSGKGIINRFDLSYAIKNNFLGETPFTRSLKEKKDCLYNNGRIQVWNID